MCWFAANVTTSPCFLRLAKSARSPTLIKSGEVNSTSASASERRVPLSTFSPIVRSCLSAIRPRSNETSRFIESAGEALDGEDGVMPTKAEAVAEYRCNLAIDAIVRSVVQIELRVRILVVDRRRDHSVSHHQGADDELDCAGGAKHVTRRGLGGADIDLRGRFSKHRLDRPRFVEIVGGGRGPVSVDVLNVSRSQAGILEGTLHRSLSTLSVRGRCCEMIRIPRRPVARDLRVNPRASL